MSGRGSMPHSVWVLDDPRSGNSAQAIAIAERLGVPFLRIPLSWNWLAHVAGRVRRGSLLGLSAPSRAIAERAQPWSMAESLVATDRHARQRTEGGGPGAMGGPPALVLSAGSRSAAVALWLKARFGCVLVHCVPSAPAAGLASGLASGLAGGLGAGGVFGGDQFDLLVMPEQDGAAADANVMRVLGTPQRTSPLVLRQAAAAWHERLGHLPRPCVALLVGGARERLFGGTGMPPARAHALGRHVARLVVEQGGSVLASASPRTGTEATDALGAGLGRAMHLLYRWGEPGENPYHGFIASADAIVVTADSTTMISEACATAAPVFVALPELAGSRERRMVAAFAKAGQVRILGEDLSPWPRRPLDEAGRVAREVRRLVQLD